MATYIIIGNDQKQYGSITEDQLRQWLSEGRINGQTKVQLEGTNEWKTLADFPEWAAQAKTSPPPPLPPLAPGGKPKTSGMAITSLVLGILGLVSCGLTAVVGLIFGIVAIVKIRNSQGKLGGFGLALAGTIISAVFIMMMPAAMLLPALAAAKAKAQEINCVNNEKQLALAVRIYSNANNHFPPAATWCDAIKANLSSESVFKGPGAVNPDSRCDYAYNTKLDGLDESKINPATVLLFESDGGWNANGGSELMVGKPRYARVYVVAFTDGSVQIITTSKLSTLRWDP